MSALDHEFFQPVKRLFQNFFLREKNDPHVLGSWPLAESATVHHDHSGLLDKISNKFLVRLFDVKPREREIIVTVTGV